MRPLLLFLALPLLFSACLTGVEGNGRVRTETLAVDEFEAISVHGVFILEVNQGKPTSVKVTADDNLHRHLNIRVEDYELIIETERSINEHKALLVEVSTPQLKRLAASGAAEVINRGSLRGQDLELQTSGVASMALTVHRQQLEAELSGASDMKLRGACDFLEATLSGTSDLHSTELPSRQVAITLSGTSDAQVWAEESLTADLSGTSDLAYKGRPQIEKTVEGVAEMRPFSP
jgi:hypothetical protein